MIGLGATKIQSAKCYYTTLLDSGGGTTPISHPLHISSTGNSAFIPFCAYKTNLNFSKNSLTLPGLTFPLCSSFLPTILEGQLCYKLTVNDTSGQGKRNELMLLLDYNDDLSLHVIPNQEQRERLSREKMNFDRAKKRIEREDAKIQINTLSPYFDFGGGSYQLSDVKRMTTHSVTWIQRKSHRFGQGAHVD